MPNFAYLAKDHSGEEISGMVAAATVDNVVDTLHQRGLVVLHVSEEDRGIGFGGAVRKFMNQPLGGSAVGTRDLALFTRQLSTLFEAGIPLVRGLRGLSADQGNRALARTVKQVAQKVEEGTNLADAMAEHPRVFNSMYTSMIRAGEGAGTLDEILEDLAVYLEKIDAIKTKVRSAMAYPIFTLIFAVGVSLFLLLKIVPTFQEIYADLNAELPGPTLVVIAISDLLRNNFIVAAGVFAGLVIIYMIWMRTPRGRYARDWVLLHTPVFGPILLKASISRLTRTFGILLRSGLPVLDAMTLVRNATGNEVHAVAIDEAKKQVAKGEEIMPAFRSTKKIPEMTLQMMATGEESGQLDAMLIKNSEFYDRQVEAAVNGITALIEPLLIILVGFIVGTVVITMFLPIFYLGDAIFNSELGGK